ncbi:alanine racemase [Haloechinothrix sp. LS1_15]|uniref:alanine racemase n=1 Tax=Haloechinothrix sp. LS1_15 TaxID=2652248 RepID=UPI002946B485|nr:alanine racemase [Haloechinothrix sp. LS1_15]MDV6012887.1 hypothetical protein [Haloechinothrix sp. LS1_15]
MAETPADAGPLAGTGPVARRVRAVDPVPIEARSMPVSPVSVEHVRAAGWRWEDLWLPVVVLHDSALRYNLARFARWCDERGMELAPHGKTTMSPHLWSAQLDHGAWGLTAATVAQARVMRRFGVRRILIANEVLDPAQLAWLATVLDEGDVEPICLVDSLEGIAAAEHELAGVASSLPVLVELGVSGRRTGARSAGEALELAERVAGSETLRLAGFEGYEGVLPQRRDVDAESAARGWLDTLTEAARRADRLGLFAGTGEIVVTAGGSGFADLAAEALANLGELSRPVTPVLRSGCYLTHDDAAYERSSPLRTGADPQPLRQALTCLARVLSVPEPGRALLGCGKRDIAFDMDLPVVRAVRRETGRVPVADRARVVELNDHHAYCDVEPGLLTPGDVVELGPSHPCTVFDKWSLIPVVDDTGAVVDAVRTCF